MATRPDRWQRGQGSEEDMDSEDVEREVMEKSVIAMKHKNSRKTAVNMTVVWWTTEHLAGQDRRSS